MRKFFDEELRAAVAQGDIARFDELEHARSAQNKETFYPYLPSFSSTESNGITVLHVAAARGHAAMLRHILSKIEGFEDTAGLNTNPQDESGRTPLHVACCLGHHEA
jgi:ankyrin repeat protein